MRRNSMLVVVTFFGAIAACGGEQRPPSDDTTTPTSFGGPPGFMVMQMGSGLHATWQDTFTGETGFELQRHADGGEFTKLLELPANATDHHDQTVEPGMTYTYRVRALSTGAPGAWSSEATESVPVPETNPPGAPSELVAAKMHGGLHVMWTDNSTDETGFELERKAGTGEFAKVATLPANADNKMDSTVTAGTTYTYRVRAIGPGGPSDWSNEASEAP